MCDTLCATPGAAARHRMIFGKNSDRQRNEPHAMVRVAGEDHGPGAQVHCTYIGIPQASRTHSVLLGKPAWIWGAEMGANEHNVVIGNQALSARVPAVQEPGLIGMDLLRLALERSSTAAEALSVLTRLLEAHGQGGDCGYGMPSYYHNGYLIADPQEAYVLETAGRDWIAEHVSDVRAISNCYSIQDGFRTSAGFELLLKTLRAGTDAANGASPLADREREARGEALSRLAQSTAFLSSKAPSLEVGDVMSLLRHHGPTEAAKWNPRDLFPYGLCVHAGPDERSAQTTGAMVSELRPDRSVHWMTGTAAPCISIFKPVFIDLPLPEHGPAPTSTFDSRSLWWQHERLHRSALQADFPRFLAEMAVERDATEAAFREQVEAAVNASPEQRAAVIANCWQQAARVEASWRARITTARALTTNRYEGAWQKMNRVCGLGTWD